MDISFYVTTSGRSPVTDFIDKQPHRDQAVIVVVLEGIEEYGFAAKGVQFRQLQGKLWEIKIKAPSGGYRFLYATLDRRRMVILHGFKKKTQKTPLNEISTALKRLKEWL